MLSHQEIINLALRKEFLREKDESCIFIDLSIIDFYLNLIRDSFPSDAKHYIPIKTNPLNYVQKHILKYGFGLEASTLNEVLLAKLNGTKNTDIVFNSPAKSSAVLNALMQGDFNGIVHHCNDLSELEDLSTQKQRGLVLRVNPLTKSSTSKEFFVSGEDSKFGEQIRDIHVFSEKLLQTNIEGLHVHQSSSFTDFEEHIAGIRKVVDVANLINQKSSGKIKKINIGGGFQSLPINDVQLFRNYIQKLELSCPELFNGSYQVATEFGRFVYANSAFLYAKVLRVKKNIALDNIILPVGANMFVREVYSKNKINPEQIVLLQNNKFISVEVANEYTIDGPLCFAGDRLLDSIQLPTVSEKDIILIKNIGANTVSLYSMHCSQSLPKVIFYNSTDIEFVKESVSFDFIHRFWN